MQCVDTGYPGYRIVVYAGPVRRPPRPWCDFYPLTVNVIDSRLQHCTLAARARSAALGEMPTADACTPYDCQIDASDSPACVSIMNGGPPMQTSSLIGLPQCEDASIGATPRKLLPTHLGSNDAPALCCI